VEDRRRCAVVTAMSVGHLALTAMLGFVVELPVKGRWLIYSWSHITHARLLCRATDRHVGERS
jgi:hypothetical protein